MARPNYSSPSSRPGAPRGRSPAPLQTPLSAGGRGGGHEGRCPPVRGQRREEPPVGKTWPRATVRSGVQMGAWKGNGTLFALGRDPRVLPSTKASAAGRTGARSEGRGRATFAGRPSGGCRAPHAQRGRACGPTAGPAKARAIPRNPEEKGIPPGSRRQLRP